MFGVGLVHSCEVELDKAEWGSSNCVEGNNMVSSNEDMRALDLTGVWAGAGAVSKHVLFATLSSFDTGGAVEDVVLKGLLSLTEGEKTPLTQYNEAIQHLQRRRRITSVAEQAKFVSEVVVEVEEQPLSDLDYDSDDSESGEVAGNWIESHVY